jgi:hypothetical protein
MVSVIFSPEGQTANVTGAKHTNQYTAGFCIMPDRIIQAGVGPDRAIFFLPILVVGVYYPNQISGCRGQGAGRWAI